MTVPTWIGRRRDFRRELWRSLRANSKAPGSERGTFSLEQAAAACELQPSWTRDSSWFIATTFNECRFRREILSLDAALRRGQILRTPRRINLLHLCREPLRHRS